MKGYNTYEGYMGWTGEEYMLFACEQDYKEWMEDALDIIDRCRESEDKE